MSRWKHLRKKIFVNRKIQGRIVAKLALYWAAYHLALWHAMFLFHYFLFRGQSMAAPEAMPVPFAAQYVQFLTQHSTMLICMAAVFPLILWDMIKVTHRVAGPLVRFTSLLKQLERGEKVEAIQLRAGDLMGELQQAFNSYLKSAGLLLEDGGAGNPSSDVPAAAERRAPRESGVLNELRNLSSTIAESRPPADQSSPQSDELQPATDER